MKYQIRKKEHYTLHLIHTDQFKTIKFRIILRLPVVKEEIVYRNFLLDILTDSTEKHKTRKDLVKETQNLYGASIYSKGYRVGSDQLVNIYLSILNEKYTEEGMLEKQIQLLSEILFHPNVENGSFSEESFKNVFRVNQEMIQNIKDSKGKYSMIRLLEEMGNGELYSYSEYGDMEALKKVTSKKLYEYYLKLINQSVVDIYVIGNINEEQIEKLLDQYMEFKENNLSEISPMIYQQKFLDTPNIIKEQDENNQSNLVIGCKIEELTKDQMNYALTIYNIILGSSADSKFFKNIREKHSLCYYISSSINKLDHLLFVRSGISKENFDKILELIKKEMQDMVDGNFTKEDVAKAKESYLSFLDEINDSDEALIETYLAHELLGIGFLDERREKIEKVTKEDIMKVASKIKMDTIYLLEGETNGED